MANQRIQELQEDDIGQTGYVVDTLYSALYSLNFSDNFEKAILTAVNLGYDTDTVGAVTGMCAGILYKADSIPQRWMCNLKRKEYLEGVAEQFALCWH